MYPKFNLLKNKTMSDKKFSFKSLFLNETVETGEVAQTNATPEQKVVTPQVQPQVYATNSNMAGVVNPDIFNAFNEVLDSFDIPGPDYLEVKKAAEALKSAIPDENTRLIAAVATVTATSPTLSKQIILDSIVKYIERIEVERKESEAEFKRLYDSEITSRQKEIDTRKGKIEAATKQITELQGLIGTCSGEINTINGEMQTKQVELDIKKKNFDATIDAFVAGLNSDKSKFETLIK